MTQTSSSQIVGLIVFGLLFAVPCLAQQRDSLPRPSASEQPSAALSLNERAFIASKMYASIPIYFAHWQGAPDLNLDAAYRRYLEAALAAPDRYSFDLASKEFMAQLHNGHSGFSDRWLNDNYGQPLGFDGRYLDGQWVVTRSDLPDLKPGQVIATIDGATPEAFYQEKKKYLSASNDRWSRTMLFSSSTVFPLTFTLTVADHKQIIVDRRKHAAEKPAQTTTGRWLQEESIAYIRIPGFGQPEYEQDALKYVKQFHDAKTLIIDVRGNEGGSTPSDLADALMDRPYRFWAEASPMNVGIFNERAQEADQSPNSPIDPEQKGYTEAFTEIANHPHVYWPASVIPPGHPIFKGRLLLLCDDGCFSACEDFLVPFKDNGRATLIGETTGGSSGQPYHCGLGDGMSFRISTKREFFPDGSPFEGIGIRPDIEVHPTIHDIASGQDVVLAKAVALASHS